METFTPPRPFVPHPGYKRDRERSLQSLQQEIEKNAIDPPLLPLVRECMAVPHCFTMQCCYGHFVHRLEPDPDNLAPISRYTQEVGSIRYRIAYLAFCLDDSPDGHHLYSELEGIAGLDPAFIQFGSADWFWDQVPNTYCLQLEPERMRDADSGDVKWDEALRIEEIREPFFAGIREIIHRHRIRCG